MERVAIEEAGDRLDELADRVAAGETVTLTRDGRPVADLVAHVSLATEPVCTAGIDWEAGRRFTEERGIKDLVIWMADDFDDPLPEDFLLRPLP